MNAVDVLESGIRDVIAATGCFWRCDGVGRTLLSPIPGWEWERVYSPDDLMAGRIPSGQVLVYDDDHYYMGSVLAERLVGHGCEVTLVTPGDSIAAWSVYTLEQPHIIRKLKRLGVELIPHTHLAAIHPGCVELQHAYQYERDWMDADAVVLVTNRISNDSLYRELKPALAEDKLDSLRVIGDAEAPNIIAAAVFSGHLAAQDFDQVVDVDVPNFRRERVGF
jgi:dimethylamine/trimethylamine dehydrogenase